MEELHRKGQRQMRKKEYLEESREKEKRKTLITKVAAGNKVAAVALRATCERYTLTAYDVACKNISELPPCRASECERVFFLPFSFSLLFFISLCALKRTL